MALHPTPYVAWLRVYEPLDAFDEFNQRNWQNLDFQSKTRVQEQMLSLKRIINPISNIRGLDGAHFILQDGTKYVAPWSTSQRCWAALRDFKVSLPTSVVPFFLPESFEDDSELEVIDRTPHILSTTWMIPPRWFSLFEPFERVYGGVGENAFTYLRTKIELAKKRLISTHEIVQRAFGIGPVEKELSDLLDWLNIFDSRSLVECDYGGLATYLDLSLRAEGQAGISSDSSIEDVAISLQGLASGDGILAGEGYSKLVTRWRSVASYEQAT